MQRELVKQHLADPRFFEENRLLPTSDHFWYETEEEALKKRKMKLYFSLNGAWSFFYAPNPDSVPSGFENPDFSCSGWDTIPVPSHIELNGYGNPQYTDTDYPWDGTEQVIPHRIPVKHNPTGCYVKMFQIPQYMKGKRLILQFEGVETAFHCWLNGTYVGYSEDSYTPAAFDITELVKEGENKLAAEVYRFSTGSWLEDQDFWRMGGIMRDVSIFALPDLHMKDLDISADLDSSYKKGILDVRCTFTGTIPPGSSLAWKLLDGRIRMEDIAEREEDIILSGSMELNKNNLSFHQEITDVKAWSAEIPYLYRLVLLLHCKDGQIIEAVSQDIGFRKVEIRNSILWFNGKRLRLNGVNRHEFSARKGRAIGKEEMEWDIRFLKRNHFNAVRTSHYPNQSYWYELCDRFGVYVMDETNLETHGTWHTRNYDYTLPGNFPEWRDAVLSRASAMLERDKNHPCIFCWSVGNESWSGQNLFDMSMYFRNRDKSRPVHYENVCHDRMWGKTTDFESRMYATPAEAESYLKNNPEKPYLLCEYSHAMGNSCGNLHEYTELLDKYPQYCGGFIWDYIDQSLYKTGPDGKEYLAYGGDFSDRPSNFNFCTNGILCGDRTISPKLQEVRYLYQPYRLFPQADGIRIESLQLFEDGHRYYVRWRLEKEGDCLKSGSAPLSIKAGETAFIPVDFSLPDEAGEYVRTASLILISDTPYERAGEVICFGQSVECRTNNSSCHPDIHATIQTVDGDSNFSVIGTDFRITFQKNTGKLISFHIGDLELVYDPVNTLKPEFWRAPTDNDEGFHMAQKCAVWKTASLYPEVKQTVFRSENSTALISILYDLGNGASCQVDFQIDSLGTMDIHETYHGLAGLPYLPCFGLSWKFPKVLSRVSWYGKGPEETYQDRQSGGYLGVYETTAEHSISPYVVPQECGNHTETRWVELTDTKGTGIRAESSVPFEFSVLPYTCHEMESARHHYELPAPYATVLRLLEAQTGVGGDNSWGAWAHEPYILKGDEDRIFHLRIKIVRNNNGQQ